MMISEISNEQADFMCGILDKSIDFLWKDPEPQTLPSPSPIPLPTKSVVNQKSGPAELASSQMSNLGNVNELQTQIVDLREKIQMLEGKLEKRDRSLSTPVTPSKENLMKHIERSEELLGKVEEKIKNKKANMIDLPLSTPNFAQDRLPTQHHKLKNAPYEQKSFQLPLQNSYNKPKSSTLPSTAETQVESKIYEEKKRYIELEKEADALRAQLKQKNEANQRYHDLQQEYTQLMGVLEKSKKGRRKQKEQIQLLFDEIRNIQNKIRERKRKFAVTPEENPKPKRRISHSRRRRR